MPTYIEQYDKIIQAYFDDEIEPTDMQFCFCGTLCDNNTAWYVNQSRGVHNSLNGYEGHEFVEMELALFHGDSSFYCIMSKGSKEYEDAIFEGMCAALEVLKEIHISRGENINEDIPQFTKRNLSTNKNLDYEKI